MEKGYPIKYAVERLTIGGGYKNGYEDVTEGYIISKCYVADTKVSYYLCSEPVITHEVVFPFRKYEKFKFYLKEGTKYYEKPLTPSRCANNEVSCSQTVDKLFDTYEEAKEEVEELNNSLWRNEMSNYSLLDKNWQDNYKEKLIQFRARMGVCAAYEKFVNEQTEYLEVTPKEQSVLVLKPKND